MSLSRSRIQIINRALNAALALISIFSLCSAAIAGPADVVMLSLSSAEGTPGDSVTVQFKMEYAGQPQAGAFNIDINYDPDVLESPSVETTEILKNLAVNKQAYPGVIHEGLFKIIVFGLNGNIIPSGNLLNISFRIKQTAPAGLSNLTMNNITVTKASGIKLTTVPEQGTILVTIPTIINHSPVMNSIDNITVNEGETVNIVTSAVDADGDVLTYSVSGLPQGATYSFDSQTGSLTWETGYNDAGQHTLTFIVDDRRD